MQKDEIYNYCTENLGIADVKVDEPMSKHTSFKIGGTADIFVKADSIDKLRAILNFSKQKGIEYTIIGNGSNLLVKDNGIRGIVIKLDFKDIKIENLNDKQVKVTAEAGAMLGSLAQILAKENISGFEFASGIPGTLGGAVVMNAGAYGGEMKDIIEYVDVLFTSGETKRYSNEEMNFEYRKSIIDKDKIVLSAGIRLKKGDKNDIEALMNELKEKRTSKQPLEYPSSGSTFKRPEGYFAGKLIEDAGLKGYRVGGAMVSTKHSGFVINYDNATSSDVLKLIEDVRNIVNEKFGVMLEPEVKIIR